MAVWMLIGGFLVQQGGKLNERQSHEEEDRDAKEVEEGDTEE